MRNLLFLPSRGIFAADVQRVVIEIDPARVAVGRLSLEPLLPAAARIRIWGLSARGFRARVPRLLRAAASNL